MSMNVSVLVKGFPTILAISGVACIWLGLEHNHLGVLGLGAGLLIASVIIHIDHLEK